jgi:hypothetical protein
VRAFWILVLVALVGARPAEAAPAADVVVVWAPGYDTRPVANAARQAGAAVIDRSPAAPKPAAIPAILNRGIEGYDKLRYDDAWKALEEAREAVDRTGAEGMTTAQLSDVFVYRGLLRKERNDPTAFDDLTTAIVIDPNRDFDPARFAPDVREDLDRARTAVAGRPRATLAVDAPPGCVIAIDGANADVISQRVTGTHWVRVTCPDHAPWGSRVEVGAPSTTIVARPVRLTPPSDSDLLIQARASGGTAFVVAEVRGDVATARLIGLDGRERDRRTVGLRGDLIALADAVRVLLRPKDKTRWYQSKWAWAAGAAILAAAIAIPITAAATRDAAPSTATVQLPGDIW